MILIAPNLVAAAPNLNKQDIVETQEVMTDRSDVLEETERTVEEEMVVASQQPPTPKPVVTYPTGCENYVDLISQYDWNVSVALQVAKAESGCNPNAVGDVHIPPVSCGLFQIRTLSGRPSCEALKNPETNVEWAYKLYVSGGWGHWTVCRTKVTCY